MNAKEIFDKALAELDSNASEFEQFLCFVFGRTYHSFTEEEIKDIEDHLQELLAKKETVKTDQIDDPTIF